MGQTRHLFYLRRLIAPLHHAHLPADRGGAEQGTVLSFRHLVVLVDVARDELDLEHIILPADGGDVGRGDGAAVHWRRPAGNGPFTPIATLGCSSCANSGPTTCMKACARALRRRCLRITEERPSSSGRGFKRPRDAASVSKESARSKASQAYALIGVRLSLSSHIKSGTDIKPGAFRNSIANFKRKSICTPLLNDCKTSPK